MYFIIWACISPGKSGRLNLKANLEACSLLALSGFAFILASALVNSKEPFEHIERILLFFNWCSDRLHEAILC